jgi:hypothetical protein
LRRVKTQDYTRRRLGLKCYLELTALCQEGADGIIANVNMAHYCKICDRGERADFGRNLRRAFAVGRRAPARARYSHGNRSGAARSSETFLGEGLRLIALGVTAGLAAAIFLSRVLRPFLFEVEPTDPVTLIAVGLLFVGVALLACWAPARRAAKVDPLEALRSE